MKQTANQLAAFSFATTQLSDERRASFNWRRSRRRGTSCSLVAWSTTPPKIPHPPTPSLSLHYQAKSSAPQIPVTTLLSATQSGGWRRIPTKTAREGEGLRGPLLRSDRGAPLSRSDRGAPLLRSDRGAPLSRSDRGALSYGRIAGPSLTVGSRGSLLRSDHGAPLLRSDRGALSHSLTVGSRGPSLTVGSRGPSLTVGSRGPLSRSDRGAPLLRSDRGAPLLRSDRGALSHGRIAGPSLTVG